MGEAPVPGPSEPAGSGGPDGGLGPATAFLTLGLRMAAALVVCGGAGYLVDNWLGTSPVFVLIGVLLGVGAAVGQAVVTVRRYL
jgi:F0F1-type ATP synthase assembly protein I